MSEAKEFLKRIEEAEKTPSWKVDQKWDVSYKRYDNHKLVADKMIVTAPNKESAESIVKRTAKVESITSVKKSDGDNDGCGSGLFGYEWGSE